jgi:hypothetical protein
MFVTEPHDGLNLRRRCWKNNRARRRTKMHERVGLVRDQLGGIAQEAAGADGCRQFVEESRVQTAL